MLPGFPAPSSSMPLLRTIIIAFVIPLAVWAAEPVPTVSIDLWHGAVQRIGHLGAAQDDFNVLGHIGAWREVDTLTWSLNNQAAVPLSFRAYRRLVADGDFNADVPIARLKPGANTVTVTARLRDGSVASRKVTLVKETGRSPFPCEITWANVRNPQDVGQYVDGRWRLTPGGLRTDQVGYDRIFLIGERTWTDYEVRTSFTVHAIKTQDARDAAVGLLARFTGHVTGGPAHFPSGQPKWGYRPFGCIAWLRWRGLQADPARPQTQFFPGAQDRPVDLGEFPFRMGEAYAVRFTCRTLPDDPSGNGVTRYQFRIWPASEPEPANWTWQQTQTSRDALRAGGVALLAHHADVTFGNLMITPLP